jgi:hypothetical protein
MEWKIIFSIHIRFNMLCHHTSGNRLLILTFRLLLIFSNCLCVHSPMLCEPQSSNPTLVYVYVMHPIGIKYVRNIKTTLYLLKRWKNRKNRKNVMMVKVVNTRKSFIGFDSTNFYYWSLERVVCDYCHHKCNLTGVSS